MMTSAVVDPTTVGTGNGLKGTVYSDGEDTSTSSDEVDHHDDDDKAPGSVIETPSYKRPFQDSPTEPDQSQAKKRRKQSKPVRLFSLTEPSSDDETEASNEGKVRCEGKSNSSHDDKDMKLQMNHTSESESNPLKIHDHNFSSQCLYCPEILNSQESLKFHIEDEHFQSNLQHKVGFDHLLGVKSEIPLNLSHLPSIHSTSPTDFVVGSLMSKFRNKADDIMHGTKPSVVLPQNQNSSNFGPYVDGKISAPGYMPLAPHLLLPLMSQSSGLDSSSSATKPQGQTPGTIPIRIFNPDAYCELCNKEFCNKYFLKTHKANKHGIYVDGPSTTFGGATIPAPPYPTPLIQSNLNISLITPPVPVTPNLKTPTLSPKTSETVIINKISGNVQMKAFCDICQKKFCNKYFVRRHKAKIHGIIDDTLPTSGNGTFPNLSDCIGKTEIEERGSTSAGSDTGSNVVETVSNDISEMGELRVDMQEKQDNNLQIKHSPANSVTEESAEPSKVKEESEQDSEDGRSIGDCLENISVKSIKVSPTPSQQHSKEVALLSSDSLRKLGVINADAFCEICCKEYCNKYFLRTHKMKRHGIHISDGDGKEMKAGCSSSIPWNHNQTSPLNLIVGEQSTTSSDSGEKIRNDFSDSDDPECDICGRRFQSFYLMQVHRAYLHVSGSERKEVRTDSSECDVKIQENINTNCSGGNVSKKTDESTGDAGSFNNNNDGNSHGGKDAISEDLQKLQTMILQLNNLNVSKMTTCKICSKVSENHYCLTAHMMTEHGILVEDETGDERQKLPSLELTSIPPLIDTHTYCFSCKKDFFTHYQLKQHIDDFHNCAVTTTATTSTTMISNLIKEELETKSPPQETQSQPVTIVGPDKQMSVTPTSSYCKICNKGLCNKYFMKTHMQRMHGIEIENGAQIGGVICDICNKELCSKYFLRVHKQKLHGIVEDVSVTHPARDNGNGHNIQFQLESDQALKPSELSDLSHRYFSHFTEVCSICDRRFRSTKWLKAHLLSDHGENGVEKWKELENQYQLISQQEKHRFQSVSGFGATNHSSSGPPGPTFSPTLKIPNNWNNQDHDRSRPSALMSLERTGEAGGHQVFASLFGSGDSSLKSYHCSYCPFTTPVLAFLFIHERSHAGLSPQPLPDPTKPFQCPVCLQSFLQADVFQHHILTHQFSGVLNPFLGPSSSASYPPQIANLRDQMKLVQQQSPKNEENGDRMKTEDKSECEVIEEDTSSAAGGRYKFRCSRCFQRFRSRENCLAHIQNRHSANSTSASETIYSSSVETAAIKVTQHGLYKCTSCGFSSLHMVIVKKHIRKDHKSESTQFELRQEPETSESLLELKEATMDEVKKKLQEAARKSQVPASYAVPQSQPPCLDQFIMQPFLLEEPDGTRSSEQLQLDRKFVPSLVFLPVREKLSEPLTVSFTLTPA
jgi:hypothetical protein